MWYGVFKAKLRGLARIPAAMIGPPRLPARSSEPNLPTTQDTQILACTAVIGIGRPTDASQGGGWLLSAIRPHGIIITIIIITYRGHGDRGGVLRPQSPALGIPTCRPRPICRAGARRSCGSEVRSATSAPRIGGGGGLRGGVRPVHPALPRGYARLPGFFHCGSSAHSHPTPGQTCRHCFRFGGPRRETRRGQRCDTRCAQRLHAARPARAWPRSTLGLARIILASGSVAHLPSSR